MAALAQAPRRRLMGSAVAARAGLGIPALRLLADPATDRQDAGGAMNFALLSPKVWLEIAIAALISAACWYGYHLIYERGADHVQRKWDSVERERAEASAKVAADALAITKDLQAKMDQQRGESNAQIKSLNVTLGSAIAGLSNRPSRGDAGSVPGNPTAGAGCTGAGLFKQDGEFLARESARADKLRIDLQACQAAYGAARDALK